MATGPSCSTPGRSPLLRHTLRRAAAQRARAPWGSPGHVESGHSFTPLSSHQGRISLHPPTRSPWRPTMTRLAALKTCSGYHRTFWPLGSPPCCPQPTGAAARQLKISPPVHLPAAIRTAPLHPTLQAPPEPHVPSPAGRLVLWVVPRGAGGPASLHRRRGAGGVAAAHTRRVFH